MTLARAVSTAARMAPGSPSAQRRRDRGPRERTVTWSDKHGALNSSCVAAVCSLGSRSVRRPLESSRACSCPRADNKAPSRPRRCGHPHAASNRRQRGALTWAGTATGCSMAFNAECRRQSAVVSAAVTEATRCSETGNHRMRHGNSAGPQLPLGQGSSPTARPVH